jgi:hypothetical protein
MLKHHLLINTLLFQVSDRLLKGCFRINVLLAVWSKLTRMKSMEFIPQVVVGFVKLLVFELNVGIVNFPCLLRFRIEISLSFFDLLDKMVCSCTYFF